MSVKSKDGIENLEEEQPETTSVPGNWILNGAAPFFY